MKLPLNQKITINHRTYRGGDELPKGYVLPSSGEKPRATKPIKKEDK